jgi:MFS family permease
MEVELNKILDPVEEHRLSGRTWRSLFTESDLFSRLWRASLLQFMAQMCGATAMKYYLPTLLARLGVSTRITLLIGGIESTAKIGMTVIEMLIIDTVGRRTTLVAGCAAMSAGMLVGTTFPTLRCRRH